MEHMQPLMQFLELVHVGDMIQSMVQVYFEKELVRHISVSSALVLMATSAVAHRQDRLP